MQRAEATLVLHPPTLTRKGQAQNDVPWINSSFVAPAKAGA
jgi:hypothetical protein